MSNQWPTPLLQTGGTNPYSGAYAAMTVALPATLPRLSAPIPGVSTDYILTQEWMQSAASFSPTALNTAHPSSGLTPDYSAFKLVEESEHTDIGGGIIKWVRKYAKVPSTHYDWKTMNYSFIGLSGTNSITAPFIPNRARFPATVTAQIEFDYFIADGSTQSDPITGSSKAINSGGDIDKVWAMQYCSQINLTTGGNNALIGGIGYAVQSLNQYTGTGGVASDTIPTLEQYYRIILPDAYTNLWGATKSFQSIAPGYTFAGSSGSYTGHFAGVIAPATSGSGLGPTSTVGGVSPATVLGGLIPAEDSQLDRWLGDIYVRRTSYVLAQ